MGKCALALVVSFLVQGVFAIELYISLPDVYESSHMLCLIPSDLQLSAIFVFVTMMLNNGPYMWKDAKIAASSHRCKVKDDAEGKSATHTELNHTNLIKSFFVKTHVTITPLDTNMYTRAAIVFMAVCTELVAWSALLATGVRFIMTARDVETVIRSTVSIVFVLQVDELLYTVCCPKTIKASMRATTYLVIHAKGYAGDTGKPPVGSTGMPLSESLMQRWHKFVLHYYTYIHLPALLAVTFGIVFGVRRDPRVNCSSHFIIAQNPPTL